MNTFESLPFKRKVLAAGLALSLGGLAAACGGSQTAPVKSSEHLAPVSGKIMHETYNQDGTLKNMVVNVWRGTPPGKDYGVTAKCVNDRYPYKATHNDLSVSFTDAAGYIDINTNSPACVDHQVTRQDKSWVFNDTLYLLDLVEHVS